MNREYRPSVGNSPALTPPGRYTASGGAGRSRAAGDSVPAPRECPQRTGATTLTAPPARDGRRKSAPIVGVEALVRWHAPSAGCCLRPPTRPTLSGYLLRTVPTRCSPLIRGGECVAPHPVLLLTPPPSNQNSTTSNSEASGRRRCCRRAALSTQVGATTGRNRFGRAVERSDDPSTRPRMAVAAARSGMVCLAVAPPIPDYEQEDWHAAVHGCPPYGR